MKKSEILQMKTIAYSTASDGIEIKGFINYDEKVICVSGFAGGRELVPHVVRLRQNVEGRLYFILHHSSCRLFIDQFVRC